MNSCPKPKTMLNFSQRKEKPSSPQNIFLSTLEINFQKQFENLKEVLDFS
jgi:hypothetical protein